MNERTRQILKGRIVSILFKAGDDQVNLFSRIAREKIADEILETLEREESYVVDLGSCPDVVRDYFQRR